MTNAAVIATEPILLHIKPGDIADVWPYIEHFMPSIVERSRGRMTLETLIESLVSGRRHLWAVADDKTILAIIGVDVGTSPSGITIATIRFATGANSNSWVHLIEELEGHARAFGCQKMEMWARKGWERKLPDYKLSHVMLEKDLD